MLTALPLLVPQGIFWAVALTVLLSLCWAAWRRVGRRGDQFPEARRQSAAGAETRVAAHHQPHSIWHPVLHPGARPWWRADLVLPLLLLAFAGSELLAGALHGTLAQAWPMAAAALTGVLLWYPLQRWPLPAWSFWGGLCVAGIAVGGWALWQKALGGVARADGHAPLHAIFFGNLSLLTGLLCLAGLGWAWARPHGYWWAVFLVLAAAGGILASALSGTRGGWLALPFTLAVLYVGFVRHWSRYRRRTALLGVLLVAAVLYLTPQTGVERRVDAAMTEARDYLDGTARGSVGSRIEMYRGALWLIAEQPLLGLGHEGYQPAMRALAAEGRVARSAARHWHAHNDLLDAWVRRGAPGFLAVLALLFWPIWRSSPLLTAKSAETRAFAVAGLLVPVAFLDFGLSYAFLAYPFATAFYGCWLAQILSLSRTAERRAAASAMASNGD